MSDYCKECPCYGCPYDVCGRGSEFCSAGVGDYCQRSGEYIEESEEDREIFEKVQKMLDNSSSL